MFVGGVWPVVQRELRATARWPLGPWLRMGGALCGVAVFCALRDSLGPDMGLVLFRNVHILLLWLICALVPALTADCLARERREGTLGLLFMTPLTASGIVLGKTMAQILRALILWLALLPILTVPFLWGGVNWTDVIGCLVAEFSAGLLGLAAGLLASSLTDNRALAFILAFLLMGAFIGAPSGYSFSALQNPFSNGFGIRGYRVRLVPRPAMSGIGNWNFTGPHFNFSRVNGYVVSGWSSAPPMMAPVAPPPKARCSAFVMPLAAAALVLLAALSFAGGRVKRSWQDKVPSQRQQNWVNRYCTPIFARWFADRMRRTKEWNPIAWLQQYSWKARANKWGLCLLFVGLECLAMDGRRPYQLIPTILGLLMVLAAAYTYAGVNGFLQERRSGALELILVSPISVKEIILGRVWGLWKQFLPSTLLLVASDIAVNTIPGMATGGFWLLDTEIIAVYFTLPIVATACALHIKNLFMAAAFTWMALLAAPIAGVAFISMVGAGAGGRVSPASFGMGILAGHFLLACYVFSWLDRNLQDRRYMIR